MASALNKKPTDLTTLAKNNAGVFPERRVEEFIDGTQMIAAHGSREMPIWGREFRKTAPSSEVSTRIKMLIDYLKSIQTS